MTTIKATRPTDSLALGKLLAERLKLEAAVNSAIQEFQRVTGLTIRVTADVSVTSNFDGTRQFISRGVTAEVMLP